MNIPNVVMEPVGLAGTEVALRYDLILDGAGEHWEPN